MLQYLLFVNETPLIFESFKELDNQRSSCVRANTYNVRDYARAQIVYERVRIQYAIQKLYLCQKMGTLTSGCGEYVKNASFDLQIHSSKNVNCALWCTQRFL